MSKRKPKLSEKWRKWRIGRLAEFLADGLPRSIAERLASAEAHGRAKLVVTHGEEIATNCDFVSCINSDGTTETVAVLDRHLGPSRPAVIWN